MTEYDEEALLYLRSYIRGCIRRAKEHRDVQPRDNWYELMMREVREARRLSQRARRIVHRNQSHD